MTICQIKVDIHRHDLSAVAAVPVVVPELSLVRELANRLHTHGEEYVGIAWGWPVYYEPELRDEAAEFQVPDGQGGIKVEIRPFATPASFTIGESGIWFYSLLWEKGRDQEPTAFMDERNILSQVAHE